MLLQPPTYCTHNFNAAEPALLVTGHLIGLAGTDDL